MMRKSINDALRHWGILCGLLAAGLLAAGCHTSAPRPADAGGSAAPDGGAAGPGVIAKTSDLLRVGDFINVAFLDLPENPPAMDATIKQDGTITLPLLNHPVQAAGKTTGQLEKDIWQFYVPGGYYKRMTVVVKMQGQFYSVKGEVKSPNRYPYATATTVLKAITSAGDFTEFARKRTVKVFRFNGRIETEDCIKALKDPRLDLPVYSGDLINVERRQSPFQR
jgi:polysaccharide export outer membrane protein